MPGFRPLWREDDLDDDQPIKHWVDRRNAQLAARAAAEAAGRQAWQDATYSGENLSAAQPSDVVALGAGALTPDAVNDDDVADETEEPVAPDDGSSIQRSQPVEPDGPLVTGPHVRFATARRGDSISRLVGTSDPAAIGRFLSLNGLDPRRSTIYAGQSYAVPTSFDNPSDGEIAAGAQILRNDNARLADLRAQRAAAEADQVRQAQAAAADQLWQQRFNAGKNVWTGEDAYPSVAPPAVPAPSRTSRLMGWLDRSPVAKKIAGDAAGGVGEAYGVARGVAHTVGGAIGGTAFLTELPFDRSAQQRAVAMAKAAGNYIKTRADQPQLLAADAANWLAPENKKLNPYATPVADTFSGELQRRFGIAANQGETAFDIGSLFFGGEVAKGLEAAAVARELPEVRAYVMANLPPDEAAYMLEPYVGGGAHYVPRRTRLPGRGRIPPALMNSRYNVSKLPGATNWQQFKFHIMNDPSYYGGKVRGRRGKGSGWSGERYGWQRNDQLTRLIAGMPADTKGLLGGAAASGLDLGYDAFDQDQPQ